jgi:cell division septal protein FtsQ
MNKKRFFIFILIVGIVGGLAYSLGWSTLLPLKTIAVVGTNQTGYILGQIESSSAHLEIGKPLARVNIRVIKKILTGISWVGDSTISRSWIHGNIVIKIVERKPIAKFVDDKHIEWLFDRSGTEFRSLAKIPILPTITFTTSGTESRAAVAQLLNQLPADLIKGLQGMRVSSPEFLEMVTMISNRVLTIRWGSAEDLTLKVRILRALLTLPENSTAKIFDLTSPTSPITK